MNGGCNTTVLPMHWGKAPRWLFSRMVKLGGALCECVIDSYGEAELLRRLSDPHWFQALSCAIGYDWHSSGTTTVTVGALKEALNLNSNIFIAGGKGREGTSTPEQIDRGVEYLSLGTADSGSFKHYSRMLAKVDSALVYDNLSIYHHAFLFSRSRDWAIVQQGMHLASRNAVRFQILGSVVQGADLTEEPNSSVSGKVLARSVDLTDRQNGAIKERSTEFVKGDIKGLLAGKIYELPGRHWISSRDITKRGMAMLKYAYELQPANYEQLLGIRGIGRKTLKSLAILASLVYDEELAERDPIMYSYNLGGKDGIPFRIERQEYDRVIAVMTDLVKNSGLPSEERYGALRRLAHEAKLAYGQEGSQL